MATDEMDVKRLKTAEKLYKKYYLKKYKNGKITKEELKRVLAPYREELIYLGLLKGEKKAEERVEKERVEAETKGEVATPPEGVKEALILSVAEVGPEDQLPVEEIEKRVDALDEDRVMRIRELYRERYGEDLELPEEIERRRREIWALKEEVGEGEVKEEAVAEEVEAEEKIEEKKDFWSLTNFTLLSSGKSGVVKVILLILDLFVWILLLIPRILYLPIKFIKGRR